MKKLIALSLTLILIFTCISPSYTFADAQEAENSDFVREAEILSALGVYTAENENEYITRGAMIQAFVNLSGIDLTREEKLFYDVPTGSAYSKAVTTAYYLKLLDTRVGARLGVDSFIGYEETVKMAVRLLGYGDIVGTKPYTDIVYKIKSLKNFTVAKSNAITQGEAVSLLYDLLEENIAEGSVDNLAVNKSETVLTHFLHMERVEGVVDSANITSLDGTTDEVGENGISVDGKYFVTTKTNTEEYIGYRVEGYLKDNGGKKEFVYIDKYDNEEIVIEDIDLLAYTGRAIKYYDGEKTETEELSGVEDIILNNVAAPFFDVSSFNAENFNGYFKLIDNDGNGKTDVIKIYSYDNYVVKSVDVNGRIITKNEKGILDFSEYDILIVENYDRTASDIANLKEDSLISVFDSGNNKYAKIIVAPYEPAGYITGLSETENIVYVDDDMYYADKEFFDVYQSLLKDSQNSALVDFRGRVAAISELLRKDRFVWAYLCDIGMHTGLNKEVSIKVLDTNAEMKTFVLRDKVTLDGEKTTPENVYEYFTELDLVNGKKFCNRQFIRYQVNSNDLVINIDSPNKTVYETDDTNDAITVEDKYYCLDDGCYFNYSNYVMSASVKLFVIPTWESDVSKVENAKFEENDYFVVDGIRSLVEYKNKDIKLEMADIDEAGIASIAAIEMTKYKDVAPGGDYGVNQYSKVQSYMVEGIGVGLDSEGNACPMLRYFSQRDGNTIVRALADDSNVFMKRVYDETGKAIADKYRPLSKGDVVRLRFDYSGKVIGVAVDFDIDRVDNGRFLTNTYYNIGIANVKTGAAIRMNYKTLSGAPQFDGTNAEEVFDLSVGKNWRITRILQEGYVTVYDREKDLIYPGSYDDLLDYNTSPGQLPVIVFRARNAAETCAFVIK